MIKEKIDNSIFNKFSKKKDQVNLFLIKNNILINILIIFIFYLSLQYARKFLPIAQETHFLATQIQSYIDKVDSGTFIYTFLRTPAYDLIIDPIFNNQVLFAFFAYSLPFIICLTIYLFVFKITNNSIYSFYSTLLFLTVPIMVNILHTIGINDAYSKITFLYPRIDIWYRTFSVRQMHGIIFLISLIFLYKKRNITFIILTFFNLFIHPNSGLITLSIFIIYFFIKSFYERKNLKILLILSSIILLFSIYKLLILSSNINWTSELNSSDWYLNLIRDEGDDFSVIYRLQNDTLIVLATFVIYFLCIWLFIKKKYFDLTSLLLIISIISMYVIFFLIEIMIFYFKQYYLAQIFLPLQPGWKILGYAIFPLLILIYYTLKNFFNFEKFYFTILVASLVISLFCIHFGNKKNLEKTKFYFSNLKNDNVSYYDYLKLRYWQVNIARKVYNINNDKILKHVDFKNVFEKRNNEIKINNNQKLFSENFEKKFNTLECIKELDSFNGLVPDHTGIIIPPYFIHFRDFFSKKNIFFQEHHDGNLSMGNLKVFSYYNNKMVKLLNTDYINLPPKTSGYQATFMRNIFLKLTENDFILIQNEHKNYEYLITENIHKIKDLKKIKNGNCFNLYKINE